MEKCAQSNLQLPPELWSHLESGQYFYEPFVFCSSAFAGQGLLEEFGGFFGSPR